MSGFFVLCLQDFLIQITFILLISFKFSCGKIVLTNPTPREVKLFTKYSLDYNVAARVRLEYFHQYTCPAEYAKNKTALLIESFIDMCASDVYIPRQLSVSQVSWKRTKPKPSKNSSLYENGSIVNDGIVSDDGKESIDKVNKKYIFE